MVDTELGGVVAPRFFFYEEDPMNYKGFHHLTWNDRLTIEKMLKVHTAKAKIAEALGVSVRTIYYEIKRGMCTQRNTDYTVEERYCAEVAERAYREHLKAKGPDLKIGNNIELSNFLEEQIIEHHFSPGAALVEAKTANKVVNTCESTLYNYIYRGDVFLELAPEHLHEKGKRHYTKQCRKKAARAPKGESIEHRPDEILKRTTFGNWEMDSVMGAQGTTKALLVLTERLSRNGILILLPDHTSNSVVKALDKLERRYGKYFYDTFKSITVDNGCEFADYEGLERSCRRKQKRTKLYYCHPYSPHERGSNENMNRIIRRFFPKGTNFDEVQLCEVRVAEEWMNNYPRKILGWKSANQVMQEYLQTA